VNVASYFGRRNLFALWLSCPIRKSDRKLPAIGIQSLVIWFCLDNTSHTVFYPWLTRSLFQFHCSHTRRALVTLEFT